MAGKGQPPKKPEDKRKSMKMMFSQKEKLKIEKGIIAEKTDEKFSTYVRNAALQRAETAIRREEENNFQFFGKFRD
ncbi:MAG: hypothetical protein Q4D62_11450 [Planctomycetia bacterium]|nr:hypothetical protein [Planctomycetia bacterium]